MATTAQIAYIEGLLERTQVSLDEALEDYGVETLDQLTVDAASEVIDDLKALLH
jgi:hypothetical protein